MPNRTNMGKRLDHLSLTGAARALAKSRPAWALGVLALTAVMATACAPGEAKPSAAPAASPSAAASAALEGSPTQEATATPTATLTLEATATEQPTLTPTPTESASQKQFASAILAASKAGRKTISASDPYGVGVIVDVPRDADDLAAIQDGEAQWNTDLCGFTKTEGGNTYVLRFRYQPDGTTKEIWNQVNDTIAVNGHPITLESDNGLKSHRLIIDPRFGLKATTGFTNGLNHLFPNLNTAALREISNSYEMRGYIPGSLKFGAIFERNSHIESVDLRNGLTIEVDDKPTRAMVQIPIGGPASPQDINPDGLFWDVRSEGGRLILSYYYDGYPAQTNSTRIETFFNRLIPLILMWVAKNPSQEDFENMFYYGGVPESQWVGLGTPEIAAAGADETYVAFGLSQTVNITTNPNYEGPRSFLNQAVGPNRLVDLVPGQ